MSRPALSAVVLCYRAEESILDVVEPLRRQLDECGEVWEMVLVANYEAGAADRTPQIVERFASQDPQVHAVVHEKEGGMGWDMRTGFESATGDVLVVIDGDAQNPVEDVVKIFRQIRRGGVDVMKGRRIARFDGLYRRATSLVYNALFRILFGTRGLWDINGKPKAITRGAYERLDLVSDGWFIDAEIVIQAHRRGLRIAEMPVVFRRNEERASFVRPSAILEFLKNMAKSRLRK